MLASISPSRRPSWSARSAPFHPWPGSLLLLGDLVIKILAAEIIEAEGTPGTLLDDKFTIGLR